MRYCTSLAPLVPSGSSNPTGPQTFANHGPARDGLGRLFVAEGRHCYDTVIQTNKQVFERQA